MTESNDHDLLIALNTKVELLLQIQSDSIKNTNSAVSSLSDRITSLETKDSRDSEKVKAIDVNVQQSLRNHEMIGKLETKISSLEQEVGYLRSRSNNWDMVNTLAAGVAMAIGWFKN